MKIIFDIHPILDGILRPGAVLRCYRFTEVELKELPQLEAFIKTLLNEGESYTVNVYK